jgi:hypothetical protein
VVSSAVSAVALNDVGIHTYDVVVLLLLFALVFSLVDYHHGYGELNPKSSTGAPGDNCRRHLLLKNCHGWSIYGQFWVTIMISSVATIIPWNPKSQ